MKILQWNLNRSMFIVWEMKRNVSVVRLIVESRSSGPPASQPVSCLTRLSVDLTVIWLRVPTQYGCCSWVSVQCVSSHASMAEIRSFFGDRVISKGLWPPRSSDLTPPDYFLWKYLKGSVYQTKPRTIDALKANITEEIQAVTVDVLARTFQTMARRVQSCLNANGSHFQHMLWCHISQTTNVLLFKVCCSIFIGVRIIKEIPGSGASGTFCIFPEMCLLTRGVLQSTLFILIS